MNKQNKEELNPHMTRNDARAIIDHKFQNMLNANRSDYLRSALFYMQEHKCVLCGDLLDETPRNATNVHHCSYDWLCIYSTNHNVPPCDECHFEHPDNFAQCVSGKRLVVLHPGCHFLVHKDDIIDSQTGQRKKSEKTIAKERIIKHILPMLEEYALEATSVDHFIEICNAHNIRTRKRKRTDNLSFGVLEPDTNKRVRVSTQNKDLRKFQTENLAILIEANNKEH